MSNKLLNSALIYAGMGWHIFPCVPNGKMPLIGKKQGGNGCLDATTDRAIIKKWWEDHPKANIGLLCGSKSGVAVVDVDVSDKKNGFDTLARFPNLPKTVMQSTPSGGAHYIFKTNKPPRNRNGFPEKEDGIDIRSTNYYIILAPSIHPNGGEYRWEDAPGEVELSEYPDFMRPKPKTKPIHSAPWDAARANIPPRPVSKTPITERATKYLDACPAAVQGQSGHSALLWAATALVVGFELDDSTAISLLWNVFNPRCQPSWDAGNPSEAKDFERKVSQARDLVCDKPNGWLLDECGLRSNDDALHAMGKAAADSIMSASKKQAPTTAPAQPQIVVVPEKTESSTYTPFPLHTFPLQMAQYAQALVDSHTVDETFAGLPMLVTAAAAMGNAFNLRLKPGYVVPTTLWGALVSASGTNKSGPLKDVISPAQRIIPINEIEDLILSPQNRLVMSDATIEAVVAKLGECKRGLLLYRGELAGWVNSFNAYKAKGGDEQIWLEMWDAHSYQMDRKTNKEEVFIKAASVCVLGGIQPKVLAECFDPGKFASGLVPRLLIANPPPRPMFWSENSITDDVQKVWSDAITMLRLQSFKSLNTVQGEYDANILSFSPTAKARFVEYYNQVTHVTVVSSEMDNIFVSKSRVIAARLALVNHGLRAACGEVDMLEPVTINSAEAAITQADWFLAEQLRVYSEADQAHTNAEIVDLVALINTWGGSCTASKIQNSNRSRYKTTRAAHDLMKLIERAGLGRIEGRRIVV